MDRIRLYKYTFCVSCIYNIFTKNKNIFQVQTRTDEGAKYVGPNLSV